MKTSSATTRFAKVERRWRYPCGYETSKESWGKWKSIFSYGAVSSTSQTSCVILMGLNRFEDQQKLGEKPIGAGNVSGVSRGMAGSPNH